MCSPVHEFPITQEIIRIASNTARENHAERVTKIALVIGDLSGFVGESINLYFDLIAKDTPCEGAKLSMRRVRPQYQCAACGTLFERQNLSFQCPSCGGDGRPTQVGKEFYIDYIEVCDQEELENGQP